MDETDSETEDEEEVYHTPKSGDVNVWYYNLGL
jgi:hypothetical protein